MAGTICTICGHPILADAEAATCRHCPAIFHASCLETVEQLCAECGQHCYEAKPSAVPLGEIADFNFIENSFSRPRTSALYRFSLIAVSLAMVLLPLIYFSFVALLAYGVFFYATHFTFLVTGVRYGVIGGLIALFGYVLPLFVGLMLVIFLIKPLFARPQAPRNSFPLNHADAPKLFALIGSICRSLDAPIPSRIDVDWTTNASAGFRSGLKSMFGNDLMLTIGLPLVAGLNLNQFAGVIAHEYGHFSQGTAMRARCIIENVNFWLYRLVHERDELDAYLEDGAENNPWQIQVIFFFGMAGVGLGRGVLWSLMALGAMLSSFMARQMEFNADQYEVKMAGSETFISTTRRLQQLNLGFALAEKSLVEKWKREKKLFDQVPDFIVERANEISADTQDRHYTRMAKRKTQLFDSHPSDAERMQRARAAGDPGVFHDTASATSLFADYPELSRRLTLFFYQQQTGLRVAPEALVSVSQSKDRAAHDYAADRETVASYCLGIVTESRWLAIEDITKSRIYRRFETLVPEIQNARQQMEESLLAMQAALAEFAQIEIELALADQMAQLVAAGIQFDPADFGIQEEPDARALKNKRDILINADAQLQAFETVITTRLTNSFLLLSQPATLAALPHAPKLQSEAKELLWVLSRLGEIREQVMELGKECAALELLLSFRQSQPGADNLTTSVENLCSSIQETINVLQQRTSLIRYPFPHTTAQVLVSDYIKNREYHADPAELILREGRSHTKKLGDFYARVLGRLIILCTEAEQTIAV